MEGDTIRRCSIYSKRQPFSAEQRPQQLYVVVMLSANCLFNRLVFAMIFVRLSYVCPTAEANIATVLEINTAALFYALNTIHISEPEMHFGQYNFVC